MNAATAEAHATTIYQLAADEADATIPPELLQVMAEWAADPRAKPARPEDQTSVWCRIQGGKATFRATDGHRMLRAVYPTHFPEGCYCVTEALDAIVLVDEDAAYPKHFEHLALWEQGKPSRDAMWSYEATYLAALADVENALVKAHLRTAPPTGSGAEKKRRREAARLQYLIWFSLGGSLDVMRVRFGKAVDVEAIIMPRRF